MPPKCEPLCRFADRLYFTTFPQPAPNPLVLNRLAAEPGSRPRVRTRPRDAHAASADETATYYYFTIDDQLLYLSFFQDWGPLNIAMVYKACILIHELLEDKDLAPHRLVLYSSDDPKRKANAALLLALFIMIVQRRAPWEAFHPISELEFMPFRDAGRGPSDFNLNIQDCLWGIWKAMQHGLCDMNEFSVDDYEYYEKVENGDWNWITPNFIAFASPVDSNWIKKEKESKENIKANGTAAGSATTASSSSHLALQRKLPTPFLNCLDYFDKRNIKLVVRLNTELYDRGTFLDRGIDHMELYFDDGTNPTDEIVRTFLDVADRIVESGGVVAVHCKAGLGRTGTLIGAYLIWKYGFTANEAIAFMRIVRPGSVVGPQQQYMYLKQLEWCKWAAVDEIKRQQAATALASATLVTPATPPAEEEDLAVMDITPPPSPAHITPVTPSRHVATAAAKAKAIATPGQPRKTPTTKRTLSRDSDDEDDESQDVLPALVLPPGARPRVKTSRTTGPKNVTASEARPTRVTRSTAGAANIRKTGAGSSTLPSSAKTSSSQGPNKIPRLATTRTTSAAKAAVAAAGTATRRPNPLPPPTPSRLPTLIPTRRAPQHTSSLTDVASATLKRAPPVPSDAWMKTNVAAVVVPATKSERPGLRPVRRRRSSFSAADVIA
ncbi:phosphoprotein phosphatase [Mycena belliarum]|uniref:protein-tyrosine-phosphatase n=1 Tax=Mycena belliarum TaxID=1033014 RepID=A0AAD6U1P1_9AGAR|nr:phosphoprotein phosphatase [Mycena belliae]